MDRELDRVDAHITDMIEQQSVDPNVIAVVQALVLVNRELIRRLEREEPT